MSAPDDAAARIREALADKTMDDFAFCDESGQHGVTFEDVQALLARLDAVTAERDETRACLLHAHRETLAYETGARASSRTLYAEAEVAKLTAERDVLKGEVARLAGTVATLREALMRRGYHAPGGCEDYGHHGVANFGEPCGYDEPALARLDAVTAERDATRGAMQAQDENLRRQLAAHGLAERFPSLTHLVDDMGEELLAAEAEVARLRAALVRVAGEHADDRYKEQVAAMRGWANAALAATAPKEAK
jgi:hypothetical protein